MQDEQLSLHVSGVSNKSDYEVVCWQGQDSPGPGYNVGGQAARGCGALGQRRCSSALGTFPRATRRLADAPAKRGPLPEPPSRVFEEAPAGDALPGRGRVRSPIQQVACFCEHNPHTRQSAVASFAFTEPPVCAESKGSRACAHYCVLCFATFLTLKK